MRGIVLAGGSGTRLGSLTRITSKQLLPIYDKPMIHYPLSVFQGAGITEILLISTPRDLPNFKALLGAGEEFGLQISYAEQEEPRGIAEALIIGEDFIQKEPVALILGDNLFFGQGLSEIVSDAAKLTSGALVFGYPVRDPGRYGVLDFDAANRVTNIIEKPANPPSNYAVTGLYFYDGEAPALARTLRPSPRGELEITDLNRLYLAKGSLRVHLFDPGFAWLDTGTFDALHAAASYVQTIQERQGLLVGHLHPAKQSILP